jgi:tRNA pseudouridine38-40 synthase
LSSEHAKRIGGFKYAVLLTYDGTRYCGWQRQTGSAADGDPSIQGSIEAAIHKMTGESPAVVGSGRTDSGVHAVGQCAHFRLHDKEWSPETLKLGLNSHLDKTIQALRVFSVPHDFHAQRSAVRKQYSYYFQQGPCQVPHLKRYSWWIKKKLDVEALNEALGALRGEHDFKTFQAAGGPADRSTVRSILEAEAVIEPVRFPQPAPDGVHLVRVRLVGTGFLKQMVRGIVGTLLQMGEGRRPASSMREILESQDRSEVGPTAPARGLWLEKVWYPERFGL